MNDLRIKIAAFALVLGLGGLGGYAMSSNRAATQKAAQRPDADYPGDQAHRPRQAEAPAPGTGRGPAAQLSNQLAGEQPDEHAGLDRQQWSLFGGPEPFARYDRIERWRWRHRGRRWRGRRPWRGRRRLTVWQFRPEKE